MALRSRRGRGWWVVLALAVAAAAALTIGGDRLAASQAVTLTAAAVRETVPLDDPYAAVWGKATPVEVPLSAQALTRPMGGGNVRAVTARALHDGGTLYVLVEWDDATQDLFANKVNQFRDAAAVEFPASAGPTVPSFCMGQLDAHVNIWHWKADWQADIDRGFVSVKESYPNLGVDLYPFSEDGTYYSGRAVGNPLSAVERTTPVENLIAGGFGSLTTAEVQPVQGVGRWRDGKWRVLFARSLKAEGQALTQLEPGASTSIAFAVWDGAAGERDGQKSVSQFVDLSLEGAGAAATAEKGGPVDRLPLVVAILAVAVTVVAAWMVIARQLNVKGRGG